MAVNVRFAVYLYRPQEFAWFPNYVAHMGGAVFRLKDTKGERPLSAPAWDHWVRVGVEAPLELARQLIKQLPCEAKAEHDMKTYDPTELITE